MPPAPKFSVARHGKNVTVSYAFADFPKSLDRQPWVLVTSVDPAGQRYPPLTHQTRLHGRRRGSVTQPLGLGRSPYRIIVQAVTKAGGRSPLLSKTLP